MKEDHINSKNISVTCAERYDWSFEKDNHGYGNITPEDYKSGHDMVGLPDHAILTAVAYIIEPIHAKEVNISQQSYNIH